MADPRDERAAEADGEEFAAHASQMSVVLDAIPLLVSFVTADERYGFVNAAYEEWFGISRQDLLGRTLLEVIGEAAYARLRPFVARGLAGERFWFEQHGVPYRFGGTRDIKVSFVPHRDSSGAVRGYVAMLEDVTAARRLQQERARAEEALAEQAVELSRSLSEARAARQAADEANRAKDEFLATASHELRTPLNAILGWAQLLRDGQLGAGAATRAAEIIERNARAQIRLIEDILDGSRIITGKLHLEARALDLTRLVHAALDSVRPSADAKQIVLSARLDEAAAQVTGDPERLQQVVWNLVNNAIKFTPKGGSVTVSLRREGTSVELAVVDSGQGISAEFLPHVFERFRQAEGTSSRRHGGLGLGLALVRHLVEAHGGTVQAESAGEGQGSRFVVTLPVRAVYEKHLDAERASKPENEFATLPPGILAGVSALVVDDEADSRELVAAVLQASGAQVTAAASAQLAMQELSTVVPHVLVSDLGMPELDGYELIRRVRSLADTRGAAIPAIALTAYSREQDRRKALAAGFDSHIAKPVEPAALVRLVASLVRPRPVED